MSFTIAEWRRLKNISQAEFACLCKVSRPTVISWEADPGKIRIRDLKKIEKALDVSRNDIIFAPSDSKKGAMKEKEV